MTCATCSAAQAVSIAVQYVDVTEEKVNSRLDENLADSDTSMSSEDEGSEYDS